jgi:hypothetical protein
VIASDLAVFHEIAGDVPEYLDPLDGPRWADLILEYSAAESKSRIAQLRRLTEFRTPTWFQHFAIVDVFLRSFRSG